MTSIGPYEVEGELGRGGMGTVLRVRHRATGAVRAMKLLAPGGDVELAARFRREAEVLARLPGSGTVVVHESGLDRGRLWFVMDLMPGGSLRAALEQRGPLAPAAAIALVRGLAETLGRCHALGLVHRDVKPENVLLDDAGGARLSDFGLARDLDARTLTETGAVLGTPGYMSPEQLEGRPCGPATDVYALGVTLYELIAGVRPFRGRTLIELARAATSGHFEPLGAKASVSPGLDAVLARALAPDPAARFVDGAGLAAALAAIAAPPPPRRSRGLLVALAVLAAAALAAIGVLLGRPARAPEAAPSPSPPPPRHLDAARSFRELVARLEPGRRLSGPALAAIVTACRSSAERIELAKLVLERGLDPGADAATLRAIEWPRNGEARSPAAMLAGVLDGVAALASTLATDAGRDAFIDAVVSLPDALGRGGEGSLRRFERLTDGSDVPRLQALWRRTLGDARLARLAAALFRPLDAPLSGLVHRGAREVEVFTSRDRPAYVLVERYAHALAGIRDDLSPALGAAIALVPYFERDLETNGHGGAPDTEPLFAALARSARAVDARGDDPLLAAFLYMKAAEGARVPSDREAFARRGFALVADDAADESTEDRAWRHLLAGELGWALSQLEADPDRKLELCRRALAPDVAREGVVVRSLVAMCLILVRSGRLDELDRWVPEDRARGIADDQRACVVACRRARDGDRAGARAELAEISKRLLRVTGRLQTADLLEAATKYVEAR